TPISAPAPHGRVPACVVPAPEPPRTEGEASAVSAGSSPAASSAAAKAMPARLAVLVTAHASLRHAPITQSVVGRTVDLFSPCATAREALWREAVAHICPAGSGPRPLGELGSPRAGGTGDRADER